MLCAAAVAPSRVFIEKNYASVDGLALSNRLVLLLYVVILANLPYLFNLNGGK